MTKALKIILDDFTRFHDLHGLHRDQHGVTTLVFDGKWVVNIEADRLSGSVALFGSPGSVSVEAGPAGIETGIEWIATRFGNDAFEARVGVHPGTGVAILDAHAEPAQLDSVSFRHWLLAFVDALVLWSGRLVIGQRPEKPGPLQALPLPTAPRKRQAIRHV